VNGYLTGDLAELRAVAEAVGGVLDAHTTHTAGFTVPLASGFGVVEAAFTSFVESHPDTEWAFANVYDTDGEPLNWW
jgi:hypothetical protein